jgi:ATP-dependent RNA helicase DeaD
MPKQDGINTAVTQFDDLGLPEVIMRAIKKVGYESPSPIQSAIIPHVLNGHDVIGQAQTGTGKTAAFALPILSNIDTGDQLPQVLVLTPTRELAIQVAEAFQQYASTIKNIRVLPIYGGQDYRSQLRQLQRQPQVIIGTPGRVMDHMRRKSLDLSGLKHLVLDEADEMLRMGFIEDVEWILSHTPDERQIALFSATMPKPIHKIAKTYLNQPKEVKIQVNATTADTIEQKYWVVRGIHKLDALTRMLEVMEYDGIIIFARTKTGTTELADKLLARGYSAAAINGDMAQGSREATVNKLKKGLIDILVATDVAARGLDVERISHVINYDIPYDTESYVHRIGRTGRAGREGHAILFVAPRERRLLHAIEKATNTKIEPMQLPTVEELNTQRVARFQQKLDETLTEDLSAYENLIESYLHQNEANPLAVAAALAKIAQGDEPLFLKEQKVQEQVGFDNSPRRERSKGKRREPEIIDDVPMDFYRIDVGRNNDVKPGNIVGAIANEAGLDSKYIGRIEIFDNHSTLSLPAEMPREVYMHLKNVYVAGKKMNLNLLNDKNESNTKSRKKPGQKTAKPSERKPRHKKRNRKPRK